MTDKFALAAQLAVSAARPPATAPLADDEVFAAELVAPAKQAAPKQEAAPAGKVEKFLDNPWVILFLLFFVLSFFGFPMLFKSRSFSPAGKWAVAISVTLYTLGLTALTVGACYWAWLALAELLRS